MDRIMARISVIGLIVAAALAGCQATAQKARPSAQPQPLTAEQAQRLLKDVEAVGNLAEQGQSGAVRAAFEQLKAEFPQIANLDLAVFADAQIAYASKKYGRAARSLQRLLDDYPTSELKPPALHLLYKIGLKYIDGMVVADLLIFKVKGYDKGVQLLERVSQEVGLQDPNGLGIKSSLAIARSYEQRKMYEEAYLKWSEIAAVWDSGQLGKDSLLGMARTKLACYDQHPSHRRHLYNAAHLAAARTYYLRFRSLYPQDAQELGVDGIISQIDEQMALKQLDIAKYYRRTGRRQAANLYLDMVVANWPQTPAAQAARQMLAEETSRSKGQRP